MPLTPEIQAAIRGFRDIILGGVPILLRQNETAFLSILCTLTAIDALSGYLYTTDKVGKRYKAFVKRYFPASYLPHLENLFKLRCRLLHNFSPAHFSLVHASPALHLHPSEIGDTYISDDVFFNDLNTAAVQFFNDIEQDANLQKNMNSRLLKVDNGGAIFY